jgi:hypothetical protein
MAGGLLQTGIGYENTATSGLALESQQQQQEQQANAQIQTQEDMQERQMIGEIGGSILGIAALLLF